MGFTYNELRQHHVTCKHPGAAVAVTHYVDNQPYCLAELDGKDHLCSQPAGYGTAHLDNGPCKWHWGNLPERVQGYQKYLKRELRERYLQFEQMDDIQMLDMRPELQMLRTLLTASLDQYHESHSTRAFELILRVLDNITNTIERIDRIQSRQVLTAAVAKMMLLRAINVSKQFIDMDKMPAFLDLWKVEVQSLLQAAPQQQVIDLPKQLQAFVKEDEE